MAYVFLFSVRDLMSVVEKEDLELGFDVFEPSVSAFAELFSEREKMKVSIDHNKYEPPHEKTNNLHRRKQRR